MQTLPSGHDPPPPCVFIWLYSVNPWDSVANTVKRAGLIMISIMFFGNKVTVTSCFGMGLVVSGVFFYNFARRIDAKAAKAAKAAKGITSGADAKKPELAV